MHDDIFDKFERIATYIKKLEPYLSITAGILFLASFKLMFNDEKLLGPDNMVLLMMAMMWSFFLAIFGHVYYPGIEIKVDGKWKRISMARDQGPYRRGHFIFSTVLSFIILCLITLRIIFL